MEVKEGYKQTEVGLIPEDWEVTKLGKLLTSPPTYGINAAAIPYNTTYPTYLRITDISEDGRFIHKSKASVKHPLSDSYIISEGDLVLARTGASVGKSYLYDPQDGELVYAGFLIRVSADGNKLNPQFLKYYTHSRTYWNWVTVNSMRSGQPGINGQEYASLPLPLPPTNAEQETIAEALSDADALIESLEQLIAKKRQIKQGAMQELLTGKKRLPNFEVKPGNKQTEVGLIPEDWEVKPFQQICILKNERVNPKLTVGGHNCIELEHISQGTGKILGSTTTTENSSIKNVFCKNDVLFGKLRAYLRKHVITEINGVCSTEVWVLKSKASTTPKYLYQTVKTERFIDCCSSSYGTHMPRSDWNIVKELKIPLPTTKAEQDAIAMILTDMDSELDSLRSKLSKARQVKQGMMHNLLTGKIRLV